MRPRDTDAALNVMKQAVRQSGRREFVNACLFRLWPASQALLWEVSRRLGDEIKAPGDKYTLLARSIRAGYAHHYAKHKPLSRHGYYRLDDWERSVYLGFFTGLFVQAAEVCYCRVVSAGGGAWTVLGPPYMDWRRENPGPVIVQWESRHAASLHRTAWRLAWQSLLATGRRRHWIERRLLEVLGELAHEA